MLLCSAWYWWPRFCSKFKFYYCFIVGVCEEIVSLLRWRDTIYIWERGNLFDACKFVLCNIVLIFVTILAVRKGTLCSENNRIIYRGDLLLCFNCGLYSETTTITKFSTFNPKFAYSNFSCLHYITERRGRVVNTPASSRDQISARRLAVIT
jgi:hypothetical protein